jgi:hypothetical protein
MTGTFSDGTFCDGSLWRCTVLHYLWLTIVKPITGFNDILSRGLIHEYTRAIMLRIVHNTNPIGNDSKKINIRKLIIIIPGI